MIDRVIITMVIFKTPYNRWNLLDYWVTFNHPVNTCLWIRFSMKIEVEIDRNFSSDSLKIDRWRQAFRGEDIDVRCHKKVTYHIVQSYFNNIDRVTIRVYFIMNIDRIWSVLLHCWMSQERLHQSKSFCLFFLLIFLRCKGHLKFCFSSLFDSITEYRIHQQPIWYLSFNIIAFVMITLTDECRSEKRFFLFGS